MSDPFIDACVKHDKALRGRVKLLGRLLGDVISSQSGGDILRTVERLRKGFLQLRDNPDPVRLTRLKKLIGKLSPDALRPVIRAFSIYFQLVNTAEESFQHRQRRRIAAHGGVLWKGSFDACLRDLRDMGVDPDELQDLFEEIRYMPVFTAHPTESKRRSILLQMRRIFESNEALDAPSSSVDHKEMHTREPAHPHPGPVEDRRGPPLAAGCPARDTHGHVPFQGGAVRRHSGGLPAPGGCHQARLP